MFSNEYESLWYTDSVFVKKWISIKFCKKNLDFKMSCVAVHDRNF